MAIDNEGRAVREMAMQDAGTGDARGGQHSHDHLLAAQQRVADELASSQGNGAVVVRHLVGVGDGVSVGGNGGRDGGLALLTKSWMKPQMLTRSENSEPVSLNWVQP